MLLQCFIQVRSNADKWSGTIQRVSRSSLWLYMKNVKEYNQNPKQRIHSSVQYVKALVWNLPIKSDLLTLYVLIFSEEKTPYIYILCYSSTLTRHR